MFSTIEALNKVILYCDLWIESELDAKEISEEMFDMHEKEFIKSKLVLESQLNIGALFLSKKTYKSLLDFNHSLCAAERSDNKEQEISGIRCEAEDCLFSFIPYAKKDLNVTN
ncbi:MAG: hypothetical protein Q9M92_05180 [Enterobacterales bacterium]|nr:hypothetical protein [Enterobacterales bacterium]